MKLLISILKPLLIKESKLIGVTYKILETLSDHNKFIKPGMVL